MDNCNRRKQVLVTGARGFIGSAFVRSIINQDYGVIAFVRDTNSWAKSRLELDPDCIKACDSGKLRIINGDLNGDISGLCENVDIVVNFAARTFVDHSIRDPAPFITANVLGTANILEEARRNGVKAFVQISTDEVYGQILEGSHHEQSPINPRNPYAASKAGADALVISYAHTFGMWTCVTRTENNYGPYQHPQKAMPVFIGKAIKNQNIPVYGDGMHVRQWLHVQDHVDAIFQIMEKGVSNSINAGEVFHIAGNQEVTNTDLAKSIIKLLNRSEDLITFVNDYNVRPGHDRRYALDCQKIKSITGWQPKISLKQGLTEVVDWYQQHPEWLMSV